MTHEHHSNFTPKPNQRLTDFLATKSEGSIPLLLKLEIEYGLETLPSKQPLSLSVTLMLMYSSSWIKQSYVRNACGSSSALQLGSCYSSLELTSEGTFLF
jgi:hypothetical protein